MKARVTQNRHECDTCIPKIGAHLCSCSDHNLTHKQIATPGFRRSATTQKYDNNRQHYEIFQLHKLVTNVCGNNYLIARLHDQAAGHSVSLNRQHNIQVGFSKRSFEIRA